MMSTCSEWDGMPVIIERTDTGIVYGWGEDFEADDSPFRPEVISDEEENGDGDEPWGGTLEEHARNLEALSGINSVARGTAGPAKAPSDSSTWPGREPIPLAITPGLLDGLI